MSQPAMILQKTVSDRSVISTNLDMIVRRRKNNE